MTWLRSALLLGSLRERCARLGSGPGCGVATQNQRYLVQRFNMLKNAALALLALALMASLFAPTSFAEAPSTEPTCTAFAGDGLALKKDREIAGGEMIKVNPRGAAPAVQAWMREQVSQGRGNFVPVQVFTNASVLCAW